MFSSFDGNASKKRTINLGGSRKVIDKDALLRSAQLEREKREFERLQQQSALRIQSWFRGERIRQQITTQSRLDWETIQASSGQKPWSLVLQQLSLLLRFLDIEKDSEKLAIQLQDLIAHKSELTDTLTCHHGIRRLITIFLKELIHMSEKRDINSVMNQSLNLELVHRLVEMSTTGLLTPLKCKLDIVQLTSHILRNLVRREDGYDLINTIVAILSSFFRDLDSIADADTEFLVNSFIRYTLSIPSIWSYMNPDSMSILRRSLPPVQLLCTLHSCKFEAITTGNAFHIALNLARYCYDQKAPIMHEPAFFKNYAAALSEILSRVSHNDRQKITYSFKKLIKDNSDDIESDEENEMQMDSPIFTPSLSPIVMNDISYMIQLPHISYILANSSIDDVITFLQILLDIFKVKQNDILISLAPQLRSIIPKLAVTAINSTLAAIVSNSPMLSSSTFYDASLKNDWGSLSLFCALYSNMLQTISDEELHSGSPVDINDVITISGIVKKIAYSMYMISAEQARQFSAVPIPTDRSTFVSFLNQVHNRDSRRSFCPSNHWYVDLAGNTQESLIRTVLEEEIQKSNNTPMPTVASTLTSARDAALAAIFRECPFLIPFETRVAVFRGLCNLEKQKNANDISWMTGERRPVAKIRRTHVFEDGYSGLNALGSKLKGKVAITFFDEHGIQEAGIDGGGVFKEFLTACLKQAFNPNYGLFEVTKDQLLYPSPYSVAGEDTQLRYLEFLGRIIGKALYEGVLVDANFSNFFLRKWLGRISYFEDLPSLDPELFQGLVILKNYSGDVNKDFGLNFTINEAEFGGKPRTIELMRQGEHIPVTNENRIRYIYLVAHYKLNTRISKQCRAFFNGLIDLIKPEWLRIFNEQELQILIGGVSAPIDIMDMKRNATYSGVYDAQHPTIEIFWRVVEQFPSHLKTRLVKFITSCQRPPLLGFKELYPPLCIRDSGSDQDRLRKNQALCCYRHASST